MPTCKQTPIFALIMFAWAGCGPAIGWLSGQVVIAPDQPAGVPSAQELLLAELLSKLPEHERAATIARALAAARDCGRQTSQTAEQAVDPREQWANPNLHALQADQQLLWSGLEQLRAEAHSLWSELSRLQSLDRPDRAPKPGGPAIAVQDWAFRLPKYQRPVAPLPPGPGASRPSHPDPAGKPETSAELAQLQRDLQRLDQRLRQWQDPAAAHVELAREAGPPTSPPRATRPSPLLPR